MDIEKTIELRAELRTDDTDSSTTYVRFTGSIDALGASSISYSISYGQEQVFVDHTTEFRQALRDFQDRVWSETDAFLAELKASTETADNAEATEDDGTEAK